MLKRFTVKNYRNFKDRISIDFSDVAGYQYNMDCLTNNPTEKYLGKILIYGRNATGKTNFGKAINDIKSMFIPIYSNDSFFMINADSNERYADFNYLFQFDNDEIEYCYEKESFLNITKESLFLNGEQVFEMDFFNKHFNVKGLRSIGANTVIVDKYLKSIKEMNNKNFYVQIPFLRWLLNNTAFNDSSSFNFLYYYINNMNFITAVKSSNRQSIPQKSNFYEALSIGNNLKRFEEFLNYMGLKCKLKLEQLPDSSYELYFVHDIKKIPFSETASSGTIGLMDLYRNIVIKESVGPSLLYLDEFDAFYHYEMSEKVIKYFKEVMPYTQIILTTHNTNLITNEFMRPDCIFILSGHGTLTSLPHATKRELREGHNLEKMYVSGEFKNYE